MLNSNRSEAYEIPDDPKKFEELNRWLTKFPMMASIYWLVRMVKRAAFHRESMTLEPTQLKYWAIELMNGL